MSGEAAPASERTAAPSTRPPGAGLPRWMPPGKPRWLGRGRSSCPTTALCTLGRSSQQRQLWTLSIGHTLHSLIYTFYTSPAGPTATVGAGDLGGGSPAETSEDPGTRSLPRPEVTGCSVKFDVCKVHFINRVSLLLNLRKAQKVCEKNAC